MMAMRRNSKTALTTSGEEKRACRLQRSILCYLWQTEKEIAKFYMFLSMEWWDATSAV